jgi:hypothetical protein
MSTRFLFLVALLAPGLGLSAQELLFSLSTEIAATPAPWTRDEIQRALPGGGSTPAIPTEAWRALLGDRNGNGAYDDAPTDVDALHVRPGGGIGAFLFSTTTTLTFPGGVSVRDGDIFHFDPAGLVTIAYGEDLFANLTETSTIDVDGFAEGNLGEIYFSFAEDETTTNPALIAQNGNNPTLDEQTVFRLDAGAAEAVIHFTLTEVVDMFNQALGSSVSTVVDVSGLTPDPVNPGALLLTAGSTSATLRGTVISSANGGMPFQMAGQTVNPSFLGLGSAISLDALATIPSTDLHPVLRTLPMTGSSSSGGPGSIVISGLHPSDLVQIAVTSPVLPGPSPWTAPWARGFGLVCLDPADPILWKSLSAIPWMITADSQGVVTYTFDYLGLPPNTAAVVQAIVVSSGVLSSPGTVSVLP